MKRGIPLVNDLLFEELCFVLISCIEPSPLTKFYFIQ
jgi:hypothetical protein